MIDIKFIDELTRKLSDAVPPGIRDLGEDMDQHFKAVLQSTFSKLDLVTREEFEVQKAVLKKTRDKLETLQRMLDELQHSD